MSRRSELQYLAPSGETEEVLFQCEEGIPLLWFLAFGTRNNWYPGETLAERGGAQANRSRFESLIEDSQYRLEEAQTALHEQERIWGFYSPVEILRRRVVTRPKSGMIRLHAPWAMQSPELTEKLKNAIPYTENAVNFYIAGRFLDAKRALESLKEFCPAVFCGDPSDEDVLADAKAYANVPEEGLRIAHLMLGTPSRDEDGFVRVAQEIVGPAFAHWRTLPPPPPPAPPTPTPVAAAPAVPAAVDPKAPKKVERPVVARPETKPAQPFIAVAEGENDGIMSKIGKLFRKKS